MFLPQTKIDTITEPLRILVIRVEVTRRERRPSNLEASLGLITVFIDPETRRLDDVVLDIPMGIYSRSRVHMAPVPGSAADPPKVARHGVLVPAVLLVPGDGRPDDADGVVVR